MKFAKILTFWPVPFEKKLLNGQLPILQNLVTTIKKNKFKFLVKFFKGQPVVNGFLKFKFQTRARIAHSGTNRIRVDSIPDLTC